MDSQLREKSIHLLAFIDRELNTLENLRVLMLLLYVLLSLKRNSMAARNHHLSTVEADVFALSPFSCASKPKFSAVSTTTALAIKTQSTENSVSYSYLSDTIVLQIYRITFLLLKFLCLQAEGAARRAEERYWQPVPVILRRPCFPVAAPRVYSARYIRASISNGIAYVIFCCSVVTFVDDTQDSSQFQAMSKV
ncbi:hypothetical protein ACE6H2_001959 [Prunus campanulata]